MSEFKLIKEANEVIKEIAVEELALIRESMFAVFTYMKENPEQDIFEDSDLECLLEFDRIDLSWMRELAAERREQEGQQKSGVADEFEKRMQNDGEREPSNEEGTLSTPVVKDVVKTQKGLYTVVAIDTQGGVAMLKNLKGNQFTAPLTSLRPLGLNRISGKNMFAYEGR